MMKRLPRISVLATGGTIAGRAEDSTQMTGYQAGAIGVESLLAAVPQAADIAAVSGEQICDIDSCNMTESIWLRLWARIRELFANDEADGIVITHGTDTMEETAYFLTITVPYAKPVILVGAMRPATAMSADGPLNLLHAIRVAAAPNAAGRGVLVVMNDEIYAARDVTKTNTENVATFKAPGFGMVGMIDNGSVDFYYRTERRHTLLTEFSLDDHCILPRVELIYAHAGHSRLFVDAAVQNGARGIVYAGMGNGSIHEAAEAALASAAANGVVVVRSTRSHSGRVISANPDWDAAGFVRGDTLNPQKARILLALALTVTDQIAVIQRIFDEY